MSKMPPIPKGNQSTKGPKQSAEIERDTSKGHRDIQNSSEQGETANIKQNTTNAGFSRVAASSELAVLDLRGTIADPSTCCGLSNNEVSSEKNFNARGQLCCNSLASRCGRCSRRARRH